MDNPSQQPKFIHQLLLILIPVFFSSFLFVGILENFKSDQGFKKELITDYFRPMRSLSSTCSKNHNDLFLKYGVEGGGYKLMKDELIHMLTANKKDLGRNYELFLRSIFESHNKVKDEVVKLEKSVGVCRSELYRKYEELALVTGTYDIFKNIVTKRNDAINAIYKQRTSKSTENVKGIDPKTLIPLMRDFTTMDINNPVVKAKFLKEVEVIFEPAFNYKKILMETEQEIFKQEQLFFEKLLPIFSKEISNRHSKGFFSWIF